MFPYLEDTLTTWQTRLAKLESMTAEQRKLAWKSYQSEPSPLSLIKAYGIQNWELDAYLERKRRTRALDDVDIEQIRSFTVSTVLIDVKDFSANEVGKVYKLIDTLHNYWRHYRQLNIVIFIQKEIVRQRKHYWFDKFEYQPEMPVWTPQHFRDLYTKRWETIHPFIDAAFTTLAQISQGIPRRFLRNIRRVFRYQWSRGWDEDMEITQEDVNAAIGFTDRLVDMEKDLADIFHERAKQILAIRIHDALIARGGRANQSDLVEMFFGEYEQPKSACSKFLRGLEAINWVSRTRDGRRKIVWLKR